MQYAIGHGAQRLVLFGWSMGAAAALLALEKAALRGHVRAVVLVDPATNWHRVIRNSVQAAHAPGALAALITAVLAVGALARLAGAPGRVKVADLDWTGARRIDTPTLVIHSRGDRVVPFELSAAFARAQAPAVTLEEFEPVPHCAEYNAAPRRFVDTIVRWLQALECRPGRPPRT